METLGMLSIGLLTIILYKSDINQNLLLPTLGLIAITAQKLIPLMQQAYLSWSNISANESSIAELVRILDFRIKRDKYPTIRPFKFESMIEFKNVSYKYPNSQAYILKDVNLRINSGDQIAIIGASGSGKSTLIDLLMGLLTPTTGEILIDGVTLNEQNAADWQNILSHVPQSVYLFDESVQTNITISNPEIIDKLRLEQAIDFAMLNEVIDVTKNNKIGENGKFLSGGQRQRIAIARAFYKRAKIIILDEATSALDKSTKNTINNNIINYLTRNENPDDMTLITITHDLNSIDYCNIVFTVQNGMIEINKGVNNG
jgi:ATP-binding cassette subfamily B protein